MVFLWIILIVYGVVSLLGPEAIWELEERMRYKDSDREPSSAALLMIRFSGLAVIALSIFGMFQSCSGGM